MINNMKHALQLLEDAQTIKPLKWEILEHGAIRTVATTNDAVLCSIIAAHHTLIRDEEYTVDDAIDAAHDLGIPSDVATDIIDMSDTHEGRHQAVRMALLRIYNLTEEARDQDVEDALK